MRASHLLLTASSHLAAAQLLGQELEGRGYGLDIARITAASTPDGVKGWTPKPTEAPYVLGSEDVVELFKRGEQWVKQKRQTGNTWINSKTCAWFARSSSEPFTCEGTSTCVTNTDRVVACHSEGATRPFYTVCFDYDAAQRGACSSMGTKTGCCFTSSIGACITYLWPGPSPRSMYRCHTGASIITMQDLPQFILQAPSTTSTTSRPSTATSPDPSEGTSNGKDSSTGTFTGASVTNTGTGAPAITENNASSNAGAIAGGVVGGVAGLALIAGGICFLLIRSRNKNPASSQSPSTNPAYSAISPGPGAPPGTASMAGTYNGHGYPSPQMSQAGGGYFSPGSIGNAPTLRPESPYLNPAATGTTPPGVYADPRHSYYDPAKVVEVQLQQQQAGYQPYSGYQQHQTPPPHSGVPGVYPSPPPGSGMPPPPMPNPGQQYQAYQTYNATGGVAPGPYSSPPTAQQHYAAELDAIPAGQQGNPVEMGVSSPVQHR